MSARTDRHPTDQPTERALTRASVPALIDEVMDSARALAADETALLIDEAEAELRSLRTACALAGVAVVTFSTALSLAGFALVMALGLGATGAAVLALASALGGVLGLWLGRRSLPVAPLARTRARLEHRLQQAKEFLP